MKIYNYYTNKKKACFIQRLVKFYDARFIRTWVFSDRFYFDVDLESLSDRNTSAFMNKLYIIQQDFF